MCCIFLTVVSIDNMPDGLGIGVSGALLHLHHQLENSSLAGPNLSEKFQNFPKHWAGEAGPKNQLALNMATENIKGCLKKEKLRWSPLLS